MVFKNCILIFRNLYEISSTKSSRWFRNKKSIIFKPWLKNDLFPDFNNLIVEGFGYRENNIEILSKKLTWAFQNLIMIDYNNNIINLDDFKLFFKQYSKIIYKIYKPENYSNEKEFLTMNSSNFLTIDLVNLSHNSRKINFGIINIPDCVNNEEYKITEFTKDFNDLEKTIAKYYFNNNYDI